MAGKVDEHPSRCEICYQKLGDKRRALGIKRCPLHAAAPINRLMRSSLIPHALSPKVNE